MGHAGIGDCDGEEERGIYDELVRQCDKGQAKF